MNYCAYGLTISSDLELPELLPSACEGTADVSIRYGDLEFPTLSCPTSNPCYEVSGDEVGLVWPKILVCRIRAGHEITICPQGDLGDAFIRLPLLGAVMAVMLHQRGFLVLHGSAVSVESRAALFLGNKGEGKSTLASSLHRRGCKILTDDIIALTRNREGDLVLMPGYPQIKLWPDAAAVVIGEGAVDLPPLADGYEKRAYDVKSGFSLTPLAVAKIYVLGEGISPSIVPLPRQEALVQLISHSYSARFGKKLLHMQGVPNHLVECSKVINTTSVSRLQRPRSLESLADVSQLVIDDLSGNGK